MYYYVDQVVFGFEIYFVNVYEFLKNYIFFFVNMLIDLLLNMNKYIQRGLGYFNCVLKYKKVKN